MPYCSLLDHGITTENDGTMKICCLSRNVLDNGDGVPKSANIMVDDITQIKEKSVIFNEIKEQMKTGWHKNCTYCEQEEKIGKGSSAGSGIPSKRIRANEEIKSTYNYILKDIDINLGNTCNIKCRTCDPSNSSMWVTEMANIDNLSSQWKKEMNTKYQQAYNDKSLFWKNMEKIVDNLEQIHMYGGEPMLVKQQWDFLDFCISSGKSKNISLHYNTNGTIFSEEIYNKLSNFKSVNINFSIDGVKDKFEYIRHLAKWDEVVNNMRLLNQLTDGLCWDWNRPMNVYANICFTVSIYNAYYAEETLDFFVEEFNNENILYANFLYGPRHFCIKHLHPGIKEELIKKAETFKYDNIKIIKDFVKIEEEDFTRKFLDITKKHDIYRNNDYRKTFPEFYNIIRKYVEY